MTLLAWMSSQARTQRSHRMQESWSTAITGLDMSVPRAGPGSRSATPVMAKPSATAISSLSAVVVCFGSSSRGGWSATSSSVSTLRRFWISGVAVATFMPSSHGRMHAAASTRPPMSTTHIRHTPTGS